MAGLLDFLTTPQGNALASGVATYMATARRGQPINSLGRGFLGGITGYQNAINSQQEAKDNAFTQQYRNAQMQYLTDKIENDRRRLDQQNRNRRDEAESGARMMKALYGGDFSIDDNGEDWQIMPVANTTQGVPSTSENGQIGIDFGSYNRGNAKMFGLSDEDMQSIAQIGQYDQKTAMRMLNDAFKQRLRRNVGGDKLSNFQFDEEGNPWAFNQATGSYVKVPGGLKRAKPSSLVDMSGAQFGTSLVPAVDAQGRSVFLQPNKGGGLKVHEGFMPQNDAEQLTAARNSAESGLAGLTRFEQDANELLNHPGLKYAVGMYSVAPTIPGTAQADAVTRVENLASKAAVAAINEMRAMSKTGGAVGQVTEKEWPKLEAQLGNLNRAQSEAQFRRNLNKLILQIQDSKELIQEALARQPAPRAMQAAPKQSTPQKTMQKPGVKFLGFE